MCKLLGINSNVIKPVLPLLLKDKTTGKNILWATNSYAEYGLGYGETDQIDKTQISGFYGKELVPRAAKALEAQASRTKAKAEVFTPSWICNQMNNLCDNEWFGYEGMFNTELEHDWAPNPKAITFTADKTWQDYVMSRRLEVTCGEAPFIVSRYDAATGELMPIQKRIGLLDRKLRVVNENAETEELWVEWATKAYQSVYGYEFQGDNLLIARINLVNTFCDYYIDRFGKDPDSRLIHTIANIVVWNIWQMDGLTNTIPFAAPVGEDEPEQFTLFGPAEDELESAPVCRIYDWTAKKSVEFGK